MTDLEKPAEEWFAANLPRLWDLYQKSEKSHPDNYLTAAIPSSVDSLWRETIRPIEAVLQKLDPNAWQEVLKKALPYVTKRDSRRGHSQLFTALNEARGWALLYERGFRNIRFIPERGCQTPDLFAEKDDVTAVLEVKSVNESDKDIDYRIACPPVVQRIVPGLSDKLKNKLFLSIKEACEQLNAYPDPVDCRIVLLVVRLDSDQRFIGQTYAELDRLISSQPVSGFELVHQISA
jgi:hypothetical protein